MGIIVTVCLLAIYNKKFVLSFYLKLVYLIDSVLKWLKLSMEIMIQYMQYSDGQFANKLMLNQGVLCSLGSLPKR